MRIGGSEPDVNPDAFSAAWFTGVSMVVVPKEVAEPLLRDPAKKAAALRRLAAAIVRRSLRASQIQVGPELECDESDRDLGVDRV